MKPAVERAGLDARRRAHRVARRLVFTFARAAAARHLGEPATDFAEAAAEERGQDFSPDPAFGPTRIDLALDLAPEGNDGTREPAARVDLLLDLRPAECGVRPGDLTPLRSAAHVDILLDPLAVANHVDIPLDLPASAPAPRVARGRGGAGVGCGPRAGACSGRRTRRRGAAGPGERDEALH
jgi:hypothetical protein